MNGGTFAIPMIMNSAAPEGVPPRRIRGRKNALVFTYLAVPRRGHHGGEPSMNVSNALVRV
jgi:hypothetical protein